MSEVEPWGRVSGESAGVGVAAAALRRTICRGWGVLSSFLVRRPGGGLGREAG